MPVMVGEEIYGEGEDDITETIALALASGKSVKTSRPSPGQFEQAFLCRRTPGLRSRGLHPHFRRPVRHRGCRPARGRRVSIPVEVLDSGTVGMALGMGVQGAVVAAADGRSAAGSARRPRSGWHRTKVYFYVPSLEQLRRGGRIGAAASLLGTMFAIKPILAVDGGKIVPLEKVRSAARAIARLEEIAAADAASRPRGQVRLAVHHFGNPAEAEALAGGWPQPCRAAAGPDQLPAGRAGRPRRAGRAGGDRGGGEHARRFDLQWRQCG